jgi:hypothetical protein
MKYFVLAAMFAVFVVSGQAQPRPVEQTPTVNANTPDVFAARYEGGLFGTSAKDKGTLKFDDANNRVVFYRANDQKEMFSIPYDALVVIYPDSKESTPQSGKVISALPLPGAGLANLMSKSTKFANITFDDPDIEAKGTASFRFDDKQSLLAFISKLGAKAKMVQRGDAYYRPKAKSVY